VFRYTVESSRDANALIADHALDLKVTSRVPFVCECDDPGCVEFVLLRASDYKAARGDDDSGYVTLPDHPAPTE
jgi:hypothetical protein